MTITSDFFGHLKISKNVRNSMKPSDIKTLISSGVIIIAVILYLLFK